MTVSIIRHTIFDSAGTLGTVLTQRGTEWRYLDTSYEDISGFDPLAPELLIVLGGAPGVYQADVYPQLKQEIKILEARLARDLPTLGICLGSQLMAAALGADVYPGAQGRESGWFPLTVHEEGLATPVRHFEASLTSMYHSHGDTYDLPKGATLLASSAMYDHQAYSYGKNAIAFQCHPEMTFEGAMSNAVDQAANAVRGTLDPEARRQDTIRHARTMEKQTAKFFEEWLDLTGAAERKKYA